MNKLAAVFLTATLVIPATPAVASSSRSHALRGQEAAQAASAAEIRAGLEERIETILLVGSDQSKVEGVRLIVEDVFPGADVQILPLPLSPNIKFRGVDVAILVEFDEQAKGVLADFYNRGIIPHLIAPDHWDEELEEYLLREALQGFRSTAGLEEVRVMMVPELNERGAKDAAGTQLSTMLGKDTIGVALLPQDLVDAETFEEKPRSLFLYAHSEVAAGIVNMELFPLAMLHTIVSLDTDPAFANQRLAEAVADEADGKIVVVGLDSNYYSRQSGQLNLKKINGMKLLLNPDTMNGLGPYQKQLLAFLRRPEALTGFILDLTSGFVRTVTLDDGKQYYALEIAA